MRRAASLSLGVALLALVPLGASAASPQPGTARAPFVAPKHELMLSRSLIRLLSDGKQIVVTRSYRIRFVSNSSGYRIDGELVGVEVSAPPNLASLADLERSRPDTGLFPMQLDRRGVLQDQHVNEIDQAYRAKVRDRTNALLAQAQPGTGSGDKPAPVVKRMASKTPNSAWPQDLFNAVPGERSIDRTITLADGRTGLVHVDLKVADLLPCGMPQRFERVVTTELAGSRMVSREIFTFADIPK